MKYRLIWLLLTVLIFSCYQNHANKILYPETRTDKSVSDNYLEPKLLTPIAGWKMIIAMKRPGG